MLISSFSGGKTSAYMTIKLKEKFPGLRVVFANTGQENEETLRFVDQCDKTFNLGVEWVEAVVNEEKGTTHKIVNFETASRKGEQFEEMIKKYGIPNQAYPHCTRELKLQPIKSWLRENQIEEYKMAIGIRWDEQKRASKDAEKNKLFYPLINDRVDKIDVNNFWEDQEFTLNLSEHQGNCKWCWKKSTKKLMMVMKENPEFFDFPERMEREYGLSGHNIDGTKRVFFRQNKSVKDLKELSKWVNRDTVEQMSFLDMDEISGCSESCEIF